METNKKTTPEKPNHATITINGKTFEVHAGNHPVVELKNKGGILKDDTLCIFVNGDPQPLDNNAKVDIKGGEIFASNCPSGGAS